jgi:hypothetical protein
MPHERQPHDVRDRRRQRPCRKKAAGWVPAASGHRVETALAGSYSPFSNFPFSWHWGQFWGLQRPSLVKPQHEHFQVAIGCSPFVIEKSSCHRGHRVLRAKQENTRFWPSSPDGETMMIRVSRRFSVSSVTSVANCRCQG